MNFTTQYLQSVNDYKDIETGPLVNYLIQDAVAAGASDIHIEPWESSLAVRVRLSGVLSELVHLPLDLLEKISGRLKVMAELISYQTDLPQEGHVPASPEVANVELRLSFFPSVRGEKIVIRVFDPKHRDFDLEKLGFDNESLHTFVSLLSKPSGLILLTGPTGSGKTTAIYSALHYLQQRAGPSVSISTVEDPVEVHLPMICQAQVNRAREFTYPIALRSLMRQDPEVIMIGEIRDAETAAIAVQAGMTGHLVISTIHSGTTAGVFARLINMEIEPFLLSSSIIGVLGVRLIRNNCPRCSTIVDCPPSAAKLIPPEMLEGAVFMKGEGCDHCQHTGFMGRSALTEMFVTDEVIRDAILQKLPTRSLQNIAVSQGMRTLWMAGMQRAVRGMSTMEEVIRVVASDQV